jgi:HK97 family phage major capsid protein
MIALLNRMTPALACVGGCETGRTQSSRAAKACRNSALRPDHRHPLPLISRRAPDFRRATRTEINMFKPSPLSVDLAEVAAFYGFAPGAAIYCEAFNHQAAVDRMCELRDELNAIDAGAKAEKRDLTKVEEAKINALFAEFEELEHRVSAAHALETVNSNQPTSTGRKSKPDTLPADRPAMQAAASEWQLPDGTRVPVLAPQARLIEPASRPRDMPTIGQTVVAMLTGNWEGLNPQAALSEGLSTDGGYFVSPAMSREIVDMARDSSVVVRAGARTVLMPSQEFELMRVTGDPSIAWVAENQQFATSQPTFGRMKFSAKKMGCVIRISRELVEDAPNAQAEVDRLLRIALGQELDRAALFGAGGNNEPVGLFNAAGIQSIGALGSPAEQLSWDLLLNAIEQIEGVNGKPTAYTINARNKRILAGQKDGEQRYIEAPKDVAELSRFVSNKLDDNQAVLGDFSQMMIGTRIGVQLAVNPYIYQDYDQLALFIRWRGDIQFAQPQFLVKFNELG